MFKSFKGLKNNQDKFTPAEMELSRYTSGTIFISILTVAFLFLSQVTAQSLWYSVKTGFIIGGILGAVFAIAGSVWLHSVNKKKYRSVKDLDIVTFKRAVILDELSLFIGLLLNWCYLYLPPFMIDGFIEKESVMIFVIPIIPMIIWAAFTLPLFLTNNKIIKKTGLREKARRISKGD